MRFSRLAGLSTAALLALAVAAPAGAADGAQVRVLHGSPDAPQVDVFVNDGKVDALSGASFGDITGYVAVPAGTYSVKVCATADSTICPIGPVDLTFDAGTKYTIAASDLLASIDANVFVDNASPVAGKADVRVVHLSADTPAVDVLTQDGSATVVDNLAYPDATDYLRLDPGSYDLKVCANADNTVCPLDPGALDLAGGKAYSVFAIGSLAGDGLSAVVAVDATAASAPGPAPTTPPTDTVGAAEPASSGLGFAAILLGVASLLGAAGSLRFAAARNRAK